MILESLINFDDLENTLHTSSDTILEEVRSIVKAIVDTWNLPNDITIYKHPLNFYQITLLDTNNGTLRIQFYQNEINDIKPHRHWWDMFSIVQAKSITHNPFAVQRISEDDDTYLALKILVEQGAWNEFNRIKLEQMFSEKSIEISLPQMPPELTEIILKNYTKTQIQQYWVQYKIDDSTWIAKPFEQALITNGTPLTIHEWWKYFIPKQEAHTATMQWWALSIVALSKNTYCENWIEHKGWPFRQIWQQEGDKIELPWILVDKKDSLTIIKHINSII